MDKLKESVKSIPLPQDLHKRAKMGVSQVKKKKEENMAHSISGHRISSELYYSWCCNE